MDKNCSASSPSLGWKQDMFSFKPLYFLSFLSIPPVAQRFGFQICHLVKVLLGLSGPPTAAGYWRIWAQVSEQPQPPALTPHFHPRHSSLSPTFPPGKAQFPEDLVSEHSIFPPGCSVPAGGCKAGSCPMGWSRGPPALCSWHHWCLTHQPWGQGRYSRGEDGNHSSALPEDGCWLLQHIVLCWQEQIRAWSLLQEIPFLPLMGYPECLSAATAVDPNTPTQGWCPGVDCL